MAETDGSIRIGVKFELDKAKKQLEQLKNSAENQTKEIERQTKAVKNLEEQYEKLQSKTNVEDTRQFKRLTADIKAAEEKMDALNARYSALMKNAAKNAKIDVSNASPEFQKQVLEKRKSLQDQLTEVGLQIKEGETNAEALQARLKELSLSPIVTEETKKLAETIQNAKNELLELQNGSAQTETEIGQTQEKIDGLNERLKQLKDNAHVADQGILDLRNELSKLEKKKEDLEAAGLGLGFEEYDDVIVRIQEVKGELIDYERSLQEVNSAEEQSISWKDSLSNSISRIGSVISRVAKASSNAIGGLKKRVSALGREKGFDRAAKSASKLMGPLKKLGQMIRRVFLFSVITSGLRALREQIGKYLGVNNKFVDALSGIKSNLLTAFQPVYDAVLPALSSMMEALESVTAKFAAFMATIFGTTASQAQESAEALYEQANATEEAGDAAKDAEKAQKKYLASFDTIEKLGESAEKSSEKEDKDKLKFDTDFDEVKAPQWLLDFWKVFRDGWNQYGAPVVQAFKDAIAAIKGAIMGILSTFLAVWTDGTGLAFLGRVYQLLQTILGIIADIANAFKTAWDNKGETLVRALFYMLNSVLDLIISIGQSFRAAWNDGSGVAICETILQIITNIFNIVGNLANRLREAWEANGNGEAIWNAILDVVQIVLETIEKITGATAEWAEKLNLEPLISSIRTLLENLVPVVKIIGDTIASIYREKVLPFLSWLIETALPDLINGIASLLKWLAENRDVLEILTEAVLAFVAAWAITSVISSINAMVSALDPVTLAIRAIIAGIILMISHWEEVEKTLKNVKEAILDLLKGFADALTGLFGGISDGINANSGALGKLASGRSGASAYSPRAAFAGGLAAYSIKDLPHLANGAVISPNNEFLAVMGDQRSGTNIETPAALMKQMFLEALAESGLADGSAVDVNVNITGSMAQFVRAMQPEITAETRRLGPQLVM